MQICVDLVCVQYDIHRLRVVTNCVPCSLWVVCHYGTDTYTRAQALFVEGDHYGISITCYSSSCVFLNYIHGPLGIQSKRSRILYHSDAYTDSWELWSTHKIQVVHKWYERWGYWFPPQT